MDHSPHINPAVNRRSIAWRRTLAFSLALWTLGVLGAPAATLNWEGLTWTVKEGSNKGPGPNYWSSATNCVWTDTNGYLHLKTDYFSNHWYCAEIYTQDRFPFGEFRVQVESAVTNLDTNIVFGFFLYQNEEFQGGQNLGVPEIDIEFARQFEDMQPGHNSSFAVHKTIVNNQRVPTNSYYFFTPNATDRLTTHRFVWSNEYLHFHSYTGHGEPGSGSLIAQWTRTSNSVYGIPSDSMKLSLHINCYAFLGREPQNPQGAEIVLRGIQVPAPFPPRPTVTNLLETFDDGIQALPPSSTPLYNFENGLPNWFVYWNPAAVTLLNSGLIRSGGTNAICLRWIPGYGKRNWTLHQKPSPTNWSSYNGLSFKARSDSAQASGSDSIQMGFYDTYLGRVWYQTVAKASALTNTFRTFTLKFDTEHFGTDNQQWIPMSLGTVTGFQFQTDHNATTNIYIDDVELVGLPSTNFDWKLGSSSDFGECRFQSNVVHSSTNAAEVRQTKDIDSAAWLCIWTTNVSIRNWTNYNKIGYWARRSTSLSDSRSTNHIVKIQFITRDGDLWEQVGAIGDPNPATALTTNWTHYVAGIDRLCFEHGASDWTNPPGSPPGHPPYPPGDYDLFTGLTNVYAVRFVFYNPWTNSVSYYVDDISLMYEMGDPALTMSVSNQAVGFGPIAPSPSRYRFVSTNYATVNYTAENVTYWQIHVYTEHADRKAGMKGLSFTNETIPLRAWAGTNAPPDPQPAANWTNMLFVDDQFGDRWPLVFFNDLPSGFRLYFASEVHGVSTQNYSAPVIVELTAQ